MGLLKMMGSLKNGSQPVVGSLAGNDFNPANFINRGFVVPVYTATSVTLSGGTATVTDYIQYTLYVTARNQMKFTVRFTVDVFDATSYGCGVKWRSVNSSAMSMFNNTCFLVTSNNSEKGKIYFYGSNASGVADGLFLGDSGASVVPVALGDYMELIVVHNNLSFTCTAYNLTQDPTRSSPATFTYTYSLAYPFSIIYHNTSNLGLATLGGVHTIDYWVAESDERVNSDLLLIGDSKTTGYGCTTIPDRFGNLWQSNNPARKINICSGVSDKTNEVTLYLSDLSQYQCKKAILFIGRNDIANSIPNATWQANYQLIYNTLISAGTDVYHQLPTPETVLNQSALTNYITANFPVDKVIPVPSGWNAVTDNVADGIQPNTSGHLKLYNNQSSIINI